MRAGAVRVWGYDAGGNDLANMNIGVGNDVFHGWTRMRLYAVDNGDGTFSFGLFFQDVGGDAGGLKGTITGTCGRVSAVTGTWGALTEGWGIGHLAVLPNAKSTLYDGSDDAYQGETAWQRLSRLGNEEGVSIGRIPGPLTPQRVGPQRPAKLVDLLEDVAESDGGWLTESPRRVGLTYRDRSSAYTQEPALTLSYTAPGLSDDLEPVDDDSDVTNDVTVTRDGGSSARAYLASGTLSVQSPPNGIGVYDTAKTLSLSDDTQPEPMANWLLHLGTYDGARYPVVTVWLHKPGAEMLVPQVLGLREGDVIRLTNLPSWLSHSDVDLIVQGWSETLDMYRWEISFNCAPGGPWNVAKAEHPTYGKADTDGTVLRTAVGVSDTSLFTQVTAGPMWTDAPKETPFDIEIAGERMRVDAVGALVTSENPYMETGIAGWSLENSTLSWDQTITHPRAKGSLKITPNGTSAVVGAAGTISAVGTVIPGKSVRCGMWVYSPVALADVQPTIHFYNSAGTFISTGGLGTGYAVPAGQWTYLESVLASPALATRGRIRPRIGGTPTTPVYVWAPKAVTTDGLAVSDSFTRTAANGWGTADTGQTWSWYGSGTAANYDVTSNTGRHSIATRNVYRITALDGVNLADVETLVKVTVPGTYTGDGAYLYSLARADATLTNFYMARLFISTGNVATLSLRKRTPTETVLATATSTMTHVAGQSYNIRLSVVGSDLKARAWIAGQPEPAVWHVVATDTDPLIPASGTVGLRSFLATANTNTLPVVMAWDDFQITNAQRFAVTRSTNGVAKPHAAGESIALARSAVASL
jgi:hypothetical protein